MLKVVLIGGVTSTEKTLLKLIKNEIPLAGVFGFEPKESKNVSGYRNLKKYCEDYNIPYFPFLKINTKENVSLLKELKPTLIFAVGFSQILSDEILEIPSKGVIGFHPTELPEGRGRAPIGWMALNKLNGAANFFLMGKGVDDGPIFVQKRFNYEKGDDASRIEAKILSSIDLALDEWLPKLKKGEWNPLEQNHDKATEYGRRAPLDGVIDWSESAEKIDLLIKSASKPHPGAITFYENYKVVIWNSRIAYGENISGVVGRVLREKKGELLIQTGSGLLWIEKFEVINNYLENIKKPIVGSRLGYYDQYEIFKLKNEILKINNILNEFSRNK